MSKKNDYFNHMAPVWDERHAASSLQPRLEKIVAAMNLKPGAYVLDMGCGTGILTGLLLDAVGPRGWVCGVDYAQQMLGKALEKYVHHRNVRFFRGSVCRLPFGDGTFSHVICFGAFPHFDRKQQALAELYRVTAHPGSFYIAHALSREQLKTHHQRVDAVAMDLLPDAAEMQRLMADAGFRHVSITDQPGQYLCCGRK